MAFKNLYFLFLISFSSVFFKAQVKEDFRYFLDKAFITLYNDPNESLAFSQNLVLSDKNLNNKIIYQNIVAQSYAFKGEYLDALKSDLGKRDSPGSQITKFHQFYIDYSLADQYQNLGLYDQSKKLISRILKDKNLPENAETQVTIGKLYQLQAINFGLTKNYRETLVFLNKSDSILLQNSQEQKILRTENDLFRGVVFINQNKLTEAKAIFDKILTSKIMEQSNFLYALARENVSRIYFLQQNYDKTILVFKEALDKIEKLGYKELNSKIYDDLSKAYLAKNNQTEYQFYADLHHDLKVELDGNRKDAINYLVSINEEVNKDELQFYRSSLNTNSLLIAGFCILFLLAFLVFYFLTFQKGKEVNKQFAFFQNYYKRANDNQLLKEKATLLTVNQEAKTKPTKTSSLSPEKENELLLKLLDFENSKLFLSNQMSLPLLASELGTNIKYLSSILKDKKDKKFNAYINDLRIQYIVNLLQTDPAYLNYKVSYLAEITGFSSHSAFAAIFKSVTGMSPNELIQQINKSNQ